MAGNSPEPSRLTARADDAMLPSMTRKLIYHRPDLCATPSCRAKQPNHFFHCDDCRQDIRESARGAVDGWLILEEVEAAPVVVCGGLDMIAGDGIGSERDGNAHP